MLLRIGELAKCAGLTVRTLHHYDHIGLLSPSVRSDSGFRLYSRTDVIRLHRIQALKQFGCSLSEIGAFLAEPGASLMEIITRQMSVLEERVLRAQSLRDRLSRLREQITRGESTGLTDWLTILELMTMYEKNLSRKELDALRSNKAGGNLDEEWRRLLPRVRDAVDHGVPPESEEAQGLAKLWMRLMRKTTGNDPALALKLKRIHWETRELHGIPPEIIEYINRAFAHARDSIFSKYLSREELETIHSRQAAHGAHWPPLIAEVRRQIDGGAAPDDPAVQAVARRWESLFQESYGGDDPALAGKIRAAFRNEPDLLLCIGVDAPLIAFVQEALRHARHCKDNGGGPLPIRAEAQGPQGCDLSRRPSIAGCPPNIRRSTGFENIGAGRGGATSRRSAQIQYSPAQGLASFRGGAQQGG
jgi:DNA-binding transcriptional MerR regulator